MPGGVILLTKCDPTDIESACAAGRPDHMIQEPLPAKLGAECSPNFDRCTIKMFQQRRAGVKGMQKDKSMQILQPRQSSPTLMVPPSLAGLCGLGNDFLR